MNKSIKMATILLTGITGAFAAAAGTINLQTRTDFVYEAWTNTEVNDPTTLLKNANGKDSVDAKGNKVYGEKMDREPNLGFAASRLRADFKGQFANDVKYRLRLRFDKTFGTNAKIGAVNSLDAAVDNAWVQPKFTDMLSVRMGKFTADGQAFEEAVVSSQDVYIFSTIDKYYMRGNSSLYGVRPFVKIDNIGELSVTVANSNLIGTEDSLSQSRLIYGGSFVGKMGMFEPVANVYVIPVNDWKGGQIDAGIGLRTTIDKFISIVDFQSEQGTNGVLIDKGIDQVMSGNIVLQYKDDNFRPQVKAFYDKILYRGDDVKDVLGFGGGVEYYPDADAKYRYHLMVTDRMTTPYDADGKKGDASSEIKVFAGVSCDLEMWKF